MQRIAIVQSSLEHYRHCFFEALARSNPDWVVEIVHGGANPSTQSRPESQSFLETMIRVTRIRLLGFNLSLQTGALRHLCSSRVDIAVLEGSFGIVTNAFVLFVRRFMGRSTFYWATCWDRPDLNGWRRRTRAAALSFLTSMADGVIVYGSFAHGYMVEHGVKPERIYIAQNTIDVENLIAQSAQWRSRGDALKTQLGISGKCVLYVGRVVPTKRLLDLIRAMPAVQSRVPGSALLVVGAGPGLEEARSMAGPGVYFLGEVISGVEACFAAADIFVMPGTGGLALNQAMAFGLPVVTTVSDGTQEDLVLPEVNGLITPLGDVGALAASIGRILEDPGTLARMGERSRQIVLKKASLANMVNSFSRAIRSRGKSNQLEAGSHREDSHSAFQDLEVTDAHVPMQPTGKERSSC